MNTTYRARGFTLMELMIAIAIMGIIAAIAIPSYLNYTRRAYFSEIVAATAPYKLGVAHCFQQMGALTDCVGGQHGIPDDLTTATAGIKSIVVANGVITAAPVAKHGLVETDTYVLTPAETGHHLIWASSGGAVDKGLAPATK